MIKTPEAFASLQQAVPATETRTFVFMSGRLLVRDRDGMLPTPDVVEEVAGDAPRAHVLGLWKGRLYQALGLPENTACPAGHCFTGLRALFGLLHDDELGLAFRGAQIVEWARTHRFCGACGLGMQLRGTERAAECACGHVAYPRISPAVIVLVRRGAEILLARHAGTAPGGMSPLAGFLEAGESAEEAIHREVREEAGIRVTDVVYRASQSWPFPHTLMLAFTAEYAGGEPVPDGNEIEELAWFAAGEPLPRLSAPQSISRWLVETHRPRE